MNQLIQQMPIWLLITISIAFIGLLGYVFGVKREKLIPDESEVIGKDLTVGSLFMKDGRVVEVVASSGHCYGCLYFDNLKTPVRCNGEQMECGSMIRPMDNPVIFKYVDHE